MTDYNCSGCLCKSGLKFRRHIGQTEYSRLQHFDYPVVGAVLFFNGQLARFHSSWHPQRYPAQPDTLPGRNAEWRGCFVAPGGGYRFLMTETERRKVDEWLCEYGTTAFLLKYRLMMTGPEPWDDLTRTSMSREEMRAKMGAVVAIAHANARRLYATFASSLQSGVLIQVRSESWTSRLLVWWLR